MAAALAASRQEILFTASLWLAAFAVAGFTTMSGPDAYLWVVMLLVQSLPYAAATLVAVVSGLPGIPAAILGHSVDMEIAGRALLISGPQTDAPHQTGIKGPAPDPSDID